MKKRTIIIFILVLFSVCGLRAYGALANQGKNGLRLLTIERILRLDDEEIDMGTAALLLSREWGTRKTLHIYRGKIDDMAREILRRMKRNHVGNDYRAIKIINEYLFDELGFQAVKTADDPEDLFLHVVIDKKRGYCLSLSVLYLAIGERIGLPLYGVVVPGHFFVRYDDGLRLYNFETTSKGSIAPEKHYIEKFKPPKDKDSLYMKNLSNVQTLGCFFNNLGNSYSDVGEPDNALYYLEKAVEINPTLGESH